MSQDILEEAAEILNGDRREAYGGVKQSFSNLSRMWTLILGHDVTPSQVCLCMIGLKITREMNCHKRDNLVDLAGYSKLLSMLEGDEDIPHVGPATTEDRNI